MKKIKKTLAMVAATIFLMSCSENSISDSNNAQELGDTFVLETKGGAISRSSRDYTPNGRKLYSSEAKHEVINVFVWAFKNDGSGNYLFSPQTTGGMWNDIYIPWELGQSEKRHVIKPKLSAGDYKFIALGTDGGGIFYNLHSIFEGQSFEEGEFSIWQPNVNNPHRTTESFTGNVQEPVIIKENEGVEIKMTLNRMVAGVLGYFTNIPARINGINATNIRIVAFEKMTRVINATTLENISNTQDEGDEYIVNLEIPTDAIYNESTGLYEFQQQVEGVEILPNSLLGGSFTLPKRNGTGVPTFRVELVGEDNTVLRSWTAKIASSSNSDFDIRANNFYSFGRKIKDNTTSPGTPDEEDKPIDLSTDQDLVITINPDWEEVHDIVIE